MDSCTLKQPRTVAEQRSKLLAHGITFDGYSEKEVDQILLRTNYYRLTGYALQFRIDQSHGRCEAQTRLRDIIAIYDFDSALRNFIYGTRNQLKLSCARSLLTNIPMLIVYKNRMTNILMQVIITEKLMHKELSTPFLRKSTIWKSPSLSNTISRSTAGTLLFGLWSRQCRFRDSQNTTIACTTEIEQGLRNTFEPLRIIFTTPYSAL